MTLGATPLFGEPQLAGLELRYGPLGLFRPARESVMTEIITTRAPDFRGGGGVHRGRGALQSRRRASYPWKNHTRTFDSSVYKINPPAIFGSEC